MVVVKFKKIDSTALAPVYARTGDAGADITSTASLTILPGECKLVPTGIALALPEGYEAQVRPRSGLALKHGITVLNTPGTIDSGYRGEVGIILINHGKSAFSVEKGMRIAQLVVKPIITATFEETHELSATQRGTGGFGHSGVK